MDKQGMAQPSPAGSRWWQSLWSRREGRLQDIRQLMVLQLTAVADVPARERLAGKIGAAPDPQELWKLRDELRAVLVQAHGELLARQRMTDISFMFAGLLQGRERALPAMAFSDWPDASTARRDH